MKLAKRYKPGDTVLSPGRQFEYEILSYPLCRLYYDPEAAFQFQPNKQEGGRSGYQYYHSYLVMLVGEGGEGMIGERFYWTIRDGYHEPISLKDLTWTATLEP
jgi:hypothetical protein